MSLNRTDLPPLASDNYLLEFGKNLEVNMRATLLNYIMAEALAEYAERIRPVILAEVEKVTIAKVEQWRDFMHMRNQLEILVKVTEGK